MSDTNEARQFEAIEDIMQVVETSEIGTEECTLAKKCYKCDIKKFCRRVLRLYDEGVKYIPKDEGLEDVKKSSTA